MHDLRSQEPEPTSSASDDRPARNTRVRSSSGLVTLGAIAAMLAMIGGIVFGVRDHERILDLLTGKAWLANDERGSITLVNGATGQAEFEMRFRGAAGDEFEIIQGPEGVFVLNRTTGEITRLDEANLTLGGSLRTDLADQPLFLIGGGRAYLVLQAKGTIRQIDPGSDDLATIGEPIELRTTVTDALVDDRGVLFVATGTHGEVVTIDGDRRSGSVGVGDPGSLTKLSVVGKAVTAIDTDGLTVKVLDAKPSVKASYDLDLPDGASIQVAQRMDGNRLWLVHVASARLAGMSLADGSTRYLDLVFAIDHALGPPLPNGPFVYVPDYEQGAFLKVDAETGAFLDVIEVSGKKGRFDSFVKDDKVWGNDPLGGLAVVVGTDGNPQPIEKYRPGIPSNEGIPLELLLPPPTAPTPPGQQPPPGETPPGEARPGETPPGAPIDPFPSGGPAGPGGGGPGGGGPGGNAPPSAPNPPTPPPPPAAGTPTAPSGVNASAGDQSALLTWLPALDGGSPLLRYVIVGSDGSTRTVDATTTTLLIDGLTNGTPYTFSVRAENAIGAGPSASSSPVTPTPAVPGPPIGVSNLLVPDLAEHATEVGIRVTWSPPLVEPGAVAGYAVNCHRLIDPQGGILQEVPASTNTADFFGLEPALGYACWIEARNADGDPGERVSLDAPLYPFRAPAAPTMTNFRSALLPLDPGYRFEADVTPGSFDGGRALAGFELRVFERVGPLEFLSFITSRTFPATATVVDYGPAVVGVKYRFELRAFNFDPESGLSTYSQPFVYAPG